MPRKINYVHTSNSRAHLRLEFQVTFTQDLSSFYNFCPAGAIFRAKNLFLSLIHNGALKISYI